MFAQFRNRRSGNVHTTKDKGSVLFIHQVRASVISSSLAVTSRAHINFSLLVMDLCHPDNTSSNSIGKRRSRKMCQQHSPNFRAKSVFDYNAFRFCFSGICVRKTQLAIKSGNSLARRLHSSALFAYTSVWLWHFYQLFFYAMVGWPVSTG